MQLFLSDYSPLDSTNLGMSQECLEACAQICSIAFLERREEKLLETETATRAGDSIDFLVTV